MNSAPRTRILMNAYTIIGSSRSDSTKYFVSSYGKMNTSFKFKFDCNKTRKRDCLKIERF